MDEVDPESGISSNNKEEKRTTMSTVDSINDGSMRSFEARVDVASADKTIDIEDSSASDRKSSSSRQGESVLTKKERNTIRMSRIIVLFVLLLAGLTASILTFLLTTEWEKNDFETQFASLAKEMNDTAKLMSSNRKFASKSMSTALTSFAKVSGQTWPNVTVDNIEDLCKSYQGATGAHSVFVAPSVENNEEWNAYSNASQGWLNDSYAEKGRPADPIEPYMFYRENGVNVRQEDRLIAFPIWQACKQPSLIDPRVVNFNLLSIPKINDPIGVMRSSNSPVVTDIVDLTKELGVKVDFEGLFPTPKSAFIHPILIDEEVAGIIMGFMPWVEVLSNALHGGSDVILIVLRNTCGETHSFRTKIEGDTEYVGDGDSHIEEEFRNLEKVILFHSQGLGLGTGSLRKCTITLHLFPTAEMKRNYQTTRPQVYTGVVSGVFFFACLVFCAYDCLLDIRLQKLSRAANKSATLVASLFPDAVRSRLMEPDPESKPTTRSHFRQFFTDDNHSSKRKSNDRGQDGTVTSNNSKPIADLFPNTTVLFADIAGFTAWSSVREPSQVFTLLETVYQAFDKTAHRRGVFKVETVGDCYVAVTGLPEPRNDHAVAMARFSRDCIVILGQVTKKLEVTLGPDTGDLCMRFGMHTGPVTAGVLRGDKSRFQVFGDTVNTAARMESTGIKNRIQCSEETVNQLVAFGKGNWVIPREDTVIAKGKGRMKTWWLIPSGYRPNEYRDKIHDLSVIRAMSERAKGSAGCVVPPLAEETARLLRLVDWVVDVMKRLLAQIEAKRRVEKQGLIRQDQEIREAEQKILNKTTDTLEEVEEIVKLPMINSTQVEVDKVEALLSKKVMDQLTLYVRIIATMYRQNQFHNFEHASHVAMSVSKLLSRIVAPGIDFSSGTSTLHDHTFGITSDPLTQFAVVFSALIHDVDHAGIPNFLLVKENLELSSKYKNKSVAEQNSVDLSWALLMQPRFSELRKFIYFDLSELRRFRQLVVNTLLATDIFDKELQELRKKRWDKAFSKASQRRNSGHENAVNRKATIVIEHLIQASDVAHTMQHWHIYQKWNERLFEEMYLAFKSGRSAKNPALNWYDGELGFFDNYIIPLAKKLKNCGVFGVSSDEYLNYAVENRSEWAEKGRKVVAMLVAKHADVDGEEQTVVESKKPSSLKILESIRNNGDHLKRGFLQRQGSFHDHLKATGQGNKNMLCRRNSIR